MTSSASLESGFLSSASPSSNSRFIENVTSSTPSGSFTSTMGSDHSHEVNLDWESWKHDSPFWVHAAAGSSAGVVEHCLIYPLDTIKTRIQAASWRPPDAKAITWREVCSPTSNGFRGLFRGLPAICAGCIPAHAALFSVYELSKLRFGTESTIGSAVCGALATISHDIILTPTDVIKQRLQLGCYQGSWDCARTIFRQEGLAAYYRSISTTLFMNVPFGAILVTMNEAIKHWFHPYYHNTPYSDTIHRTLPSDTTITQDEPLPHPTLSSLSIYFISAGIAGGIAGALTTPLDVIKTRLQTQEMGGKLYPLHTPYSHNSPRIPSSLHNKTTFFSHNLHTWFKKTSSVSNKPPHDSFLNQHTRHIRCPNHTIIGTERPLSPQPRYTNFLSSVQLIMKEEGCRGFWKGTTARVILSIPSAAVCWGTYETVKLLINRGVSSS